jgi:2-polyprenyl-3-methyl-5-hydroxy-6-metoxy-1,4-benzoquinol methylase
MQTISLCPVCERTSFATHLLCEDFTVSHETFSIVKCQGCGLLATSPRPLDDNLGEYYISDNYVSHTNTSKSLIDVIYRISRRFTLRWKLNLVRRRVTNSKNFSLLDYGCGTGDFLKTCKDEGAAISGFEPSDIARSIAVNKIGNVIASDAAQLKPGFDTITLWHVLEHVPDLNNILQKLASLLNKHGIIFIAVPNHESPDAQKYANHWAGYDVPRHLWHFSKNNMKLLLRKNKLELIDIVPMKLDAFYVSILSEKYKNQKSSITSLVTGILAGLASNLKAGKNNHSSLIYIARK